MKTQSRNQTNLQSTFNADDCQYDILDADDRYVINIQINIILDVIAFSLQLVSEETKKNERLFLFLNEPIRQIIFYHLYEPIRQILYRPNVPIRQNFSFLLNQTIKQNFIINNACGIFLEGVRKSRFRNNVIAENDIAMQIFSSSDNCEFTANNFVAHLKSVAFGSIVSACIPRSDRLAPAI